MPTQLHVPESMHTKLGAHLLRQGAVNEEAAFLFARHSTSGTDHVLSAIDWLPLPTSAFASRSSHYLELTDATRGSLIKRAHDLGTCLVEFHSHLDQGAASFSWSDVAGLTDFVPHVRWRLKGRPYAAAVMTKNSFDALVWVTTSPDPDLLEGILVGRDLIRPTNRSLASWSARDGR